MGEMIEKCARAAFECAMRQPYGDVTRRWEDLGDGQRYWVDTTAAVIDALMEPSPQVIAGGLTAYELTGISATAIGTAEDHVELIWQAMLSKAKSE